MTREHAKSGNTSLEHDFLKVLMTYTEYKIGKNWTQK